MRLILLLGLVSLLGDLTYEGARSVVGPYLGLLGAGVASVGLVAGLGEGAGYGLRVVFGRLADRTGRYWGITLAGYTLNLLAVPLLALAGRWEMAALLVISERLGKAIRTPARDTILSQAASRVGRGRAFGFHEAMDQLGAFSGPLLVALILSRGGGYAPAFGWLAVPALATMMVLLFARARYPHPVPGAESPQPSGPPPTGGLPRRFWIYAAFASLSVAGFPHFALVSVHAGQQGVLTPPQIPLLFALAMGVDAVSALAAGWLYDRRGLRSLGWMPILTAGLPFLVFSLDARAMWLGAVLWGIVLGVHESTLRAAVGDLVPAGRQGQGYGDFNALFGLAWLAGSALLGVLYERGVALVWVFVLAAQLAAALTFGLGGLAGRASRT